MHGIICILRKNSIIYAGNIISLHLRIHREYKKLRILCADDAGSRKRIVCAVIPFKDHAAAAFSAGDRIPLSVFAFMPVQADNRSAFSKSACMSS